MKCDYFFLAAFLRVAFFLVAFFFVAAFFVAFFLVALRFAAFFRAAMTGFPPLSITLIVAVVPARRPGSDQIRALPARLDQPLRWVTPTENTVRDEPRSASRFRSARAFSSR